MKRTLVLINSKDRIDSTTTPSNFKVRLDRAIHNVSSIQIRSIEIPFSFYPINVNNNTVAWEDNVPNSYSCTLTNKYYTGSDLATELATKMNAEMSGFTVTYDNNTMKFTFANATQFKFVPDSMSGDVLLGISNTITQSLGTSKVSDRVVNFAGSNYLLIESSNLSGGRALSQLSGKTRRPVLCKVPVNQDFGLILYMEAQSDDLMLRYDQNFRFDEIDFQVVDSDFNEVDFNGSDWSIELLVTSKQD